MNKELTVSQLFDLTGKTCLITGASGHLGGAMASAMAEAGATVIVASRDKKRAESIAQKLPPNTKHHGVEIDHLDEQSIHSGFKDALKCTGTIDILINNGNYSIDADWHNITGDEFNQQLENLTGYFLLSRLVRDYAVEQEQEASVILLGSMYGVVGSYPQAYENICNASSVAYHAQKGGIIQMARHLAVYWAKDRVRVNCLSPGPFPSEQASTEMVERLCTKSPLGRMGQPDELKGAIVFLASNASSYMTGQNLIIDGGWTAW